MKTANCLPLLRKLEMTSEGVLVKGLRALDPDEADAMECIEQYIPPVALNKEHELEFELVTSIRHCDSYA